MNAAPDACVGWTLPDRTLHVGTFQRYQTEVENPDNVGRAVQLVEMDGQTMVVGGPVRLAGGRGAMR
ncbi:MAG: hypothetical protein OQK79_14325 [Rhodanobacter sp.]|jgi:hypothetical protein|nr:hypothetical protein [Rhodanobacter sp.]